MKNILLKLVFVSVAAFLVGCNSEKEEVVSAKDINFIDPLIVERDLKSNYLKELNILAFSGFSQEYLFIQTYSDAPQIIAYNQKLVNKLSIEEIKLDYQILTMSFKTLNYQKQERINDLSMVSYKPTKKMLSNIQEKNDVMIALVGQLHNEMLRKTGGKEGLLDDKNLDLTKQDSIDKLKNKMNGLILNSQDLIHFIDVKFHVLQSRIEDRSFVFRDALDSYIGHDLIKLRIDSMSKDDPELPKVQEQLKYILSIKDRVKDYLKYIYKTN